MRATVLAAVMVLGFSPAAAQTPLQPSGKWTVEYDDDMCVLRRSFGTGADAVTFALRPLPLGEQDELVVVSANPRGPLQGSGEGAVTLKPSGTIVSANYTSYRLAKDHVRLTTMFLEHDETKALASSAQIAIRAGDLVATDLAPGPMGKAMTVLKACSDHLLQTWGIDPAAANLVKVRAKANVGAMFSVDNYPPEAISAHQEGRVVAAYQVDLSGRARDCRVVVSSKSPALDQQTCAVIEQRVHFKPALGENDKPIPSTETTAVRWVLPS